MCGEFKVCWWCATGPCFSVDTGERRGHGGKAAGTDGRTGPCDPPHYTRGIFTSSPSPTARLCVCGLV